MKCIGWWFFHKWGKYSEPVLCHTTSGQAQIQTRHCEKCNAVSWRYVT